MTEYNPSDRVCVVVFGSPIESLRSTPEDIPYEELFFTVKNYIDDSDLDKIERDISPNVYITFGDYTKFKKLNSAPFNIRKKWMNFKDGEDLTLVGQAVFERFRINCFEPPSEYPLISAVTCAYKSGSKIFRLLDSLQEQSYQNWEWIIYDDSDDNYETFDSLVNLSKLDSRVKVFKGHKNSGRIGQVKKRAFSLASGDYLCEIDHDDELTKDCLLWLVNTFIKYPDVGMAYTDCAEYIEATGECVNYGDDFAFGFGSYRTEVYKNRKYLVTNYPRINQHTIRHIVGVANHVRCWRASTYRNLGGHNEKLHVADDYELILRTFLNSRIAHIPKFGYIQYLNSDSSNTTDRRRPEIQRLVRMIQEYYDKQIHDRLISLGLPDDLWNPKTQSSERYRKVADSFAHGCIISDV